MWIDRAVNNPEQPGDREIAIQRINMLIAHDTLEHLPRISQPSLVICGELNLCTPLPLSEELARGIPNAELVILKEAGELIDIEKPDEFYETVSSFVARFEQNSPTK
ncbi:hypothetical protein DFR47_11151 [Pseudochrobactrum asaccharolyticum]|uniref:Alpha/beta hydrolase family protein n=2 Tax=Pseudochrobactrum asaccharolyticum TaxID=354351 RepID=A0A366DLM8_9HYPH|nr:hypothetical protein DFR47_11151 [Pseudochrobactrum asaccharolyticum]